MCLDNRLFIGDMAKSRCALLEDLLKTDEVPQLERILDGVKLAPFQTKGAAFAFLSNKALIGDDPGLGKTLQTAAYLRLHQFHGTLKKILVVTEKSAVFQFMAEIYKTTGLVLLPVYGDAIKIDRILKNLDYRQFDGIITTHSAVGVGNQFLRLFLKYKHDFNTIVYDESSVLATQGSQRYYVAQGLFRYFENKLMLNGTALTTKLDQIHNQIRILDPKALPSMYKVNKEYGVFEKARFGRRFTLTKYKNTRDYIERLRYYYIGRSRSDVNIITDYRPQLHIVDQTDMQRQLCNNSNYMQVLFNPSGLIKPNMNEIPALKKLIELTEERLKLGNVVIFAEYINIKPVIRALLKKHIWNARVGIIDDAISSSEGLDRETERLKFENGEYNILIINITKSLNLGSANSMIFYTIPYDVYQAVLRIDRGVISKKKYYDFIVYDDSKQLNDITGRFLESEKLMNDALRKDYSIFNTLVKQLMYVKSMSNILI